MLHCEKDQGAFKPLLSPTQFELLKRLKQLPVKSSRTQFCPPCLMCFSAGGDIIIC